MSAVVLKPHERASSVPRNLIALLPRSSVPSFHPPCIVIQAANFPPFSQHYPTSPNNSSPPTSRQVWIFYCPSWPQQCSPLSTVFDLIKAADEEHAALGGPILALDR